MSKFILAILITFLAYIIFGLLVDYIINNTHPHILLELALRAIHLVGSITVFASIIGVKPHK
jgi:hypothetical protein